MSANIQWAMKLTSRCAEFLDHYGRGWLLTMQRGDLCCWLHVQSDHKRQQQSSNYRTNRFSGHLTPPWKDRSEAWGPPAASLKATGFEDTRLGFNVQGRWIAIVIFHPQCMPFLPDKPDGA